MDVFDQTDVIESQVLELTIDAARKAGRELEPIGECHNCGEPFGPAGAEKLFCDDECAKDWERFKHVGH